MFTRTRYQYGSLEIKERKKGKEVWEFRYYETDGRGERQRRAAIVGTKEEYPTESAARKCPAVQAILLRLNAEQPRAVSGAAEFGAVIATSGASCTQSFSVRKGGNSSTRTRLSWFG